MSRGLKAALVRVGCVLTGRFLRSLILERQTLLQRLSSAERRACSFALHQLLHATTDLAAVTI